MNISLTDYKSQLFFFLCFGATIEAKGFGVEDSLSLEH